MATREQVPFLAGADFPPSATAAFEVTNRLAVLVDESGEAVRSNDSVCGGSGSEELRQRVGLPDVILVQECYVIDIRWQLRKSTVARARDAAVALFDHSKAVVTQASGKFGCPVGRPVVYYDACEVLVCLCHNTRDSRVEGGYAVVCCDNDADHGNYDITCSREGRFHSVLA